MGEILNFGVIATIAYVDEYGNDVTAVLNEIDKRNVECETCECRECIEGEECDMVQDQAQEVEIVQALKYDNSFFEVNNIVYVLTNDEQESHGRISYIGEDYITLDMSCDFYSDEVCIDKVDIICIEKDDSDNGLIERLLNDMPEEDE